MKERMETNKPWGLKGTGNGGRDSRSDRKGGGYRWAVGDRVHMSALIMLIGLVQLVVVLLLWRDDSKTTLIVVCSSTDHTNVVIKWQWMVMDRGWQ